MIQKEKEEIFLSETDFSGSFLNALSMSGDGSKRGRMARRRLDDYEDDGYKSKNLHAERKRRKKLSDRLLSLRAIVPIITNMNKATIIEDALTYIQELQSNVQILSDTLLEVEAYSSEEGAKVQRNETAAAEEMRQSGIQEDVQVIKIEGNKVWIKIVMEKKKGKFSNLIEQINYMDLEVVDVNVTTSKGAMLVSCCVMGAQGGIPAVHQTKEMLLEIVRNIQEE